ncbi:MAG: phosphoribosylformylglycinamidine cyclo-ligase [Nitrospirae bacterium]|nr:phosphoribosylformylglycinamidine cyclo-ligase [Nitrospirota bacterium]MCL5284687.1 phosphoribosylformylglycinamidine cyclo-ligase [Nitrospirota bacterium]
MSKEKEEGAYARSGVSIDRGNRWVEAIKPLAGRTNRTGVVSGIGGFGGVFRPDFARYEDPVLVSGTDGVGTKLLVARWARRFSGLGIDLVAMCANDIAVMGADPLFFLDYLATGRLEIDESLPVMEGVVEGCLQSEMALLGGETAEMPGLYAPGDFDLAGFCVGIADRKKIIDGASIRPGDHVFGIASSGLHSNGYSLARRVLLEQGPVDPGVSVPFEPGTTWGELLTTPTRIYVRLMAAIRKALPVGAFVHVTGGGLTENIPRILPDNASVRIDLGSWPVPPLFSHIRQAGGIDLPEMLRVFNMGIGLVVIVSPDASSSLDSLLTSRGEAFWRLGEVVAGRQEVLYAGA